MSLRTAIAGMRLTTRPLPDPSFTSQLAKTLRVTSSGGLSRPDDLDVVADRFLSCISRGDDPDYSDWNKAAWCLWTTTPALAEHSTALDAILSRVARMERIRPYRHLASVYLVDFSPDRPGLLQVSKVLTDCAPKAGHPWSTLNARYGLFAESGAPNRLAQISMRHNEGVAELFAAIGLGYQFAEGGFARAVHEAGLAHLVGIPINSATERLEIVRRWCLRPEGSIIFRALRKHMVGAILVPYGDQVPAKDERDRIINFLVGMFGDPRTSASTWIGMDEYADIMKRWLTEQSLRQFFDVVDKIAPDRAWKYRRAFWQAFHEVGLIRNAWVVFGHDGSAAARRAFGKEAQFGTFQGGGRKQVQVGHAVLLLDFGQCVIADWSYSGFCNVWPSSDPQKPQLNRTRYTSDEIRRPVPSDRTEANLTRHDIFGHGGSENYVWQRRVAGRIFDLCGVRIPQRAYVV